MRITRLMVTAIVAILLVASSLAGSEPAGIPINEEQLRKLRYGLPTEVLGLVITNVVDRETGKSINTVEEVHEIKDGRLSRKVGYNRLRWEVPSDTMKPLTLYSQGYRPLELRGVRIPWDSLVIITVRMKRGDSSRTVSYEEAWKCCIDTAYVDLDDFLPKNTIEGHIRDGRLKVPVAGARVFCEETGGTTLTDDSGYYRVFLDDHKTAVLHCWHPWYDSLKFEVEKGVVRGAKIVNLTFAGEENAGREGVRPNDVVHFLVSKEGWSSWARAVNQQRDIFTYAVDVGRLFGPFDSWLFGECPPFRLIAPENDGKSWVQFTKAIKLESTRKPSGENFTLVTDSTLRFRTKSEDAGTTYTLRRIPAAQPGATGLLDFDMNPDSILRRNSTQRESHRACDSLRAELERVHLNNYFLIEERRLGELAELFSADFAPSFDPFPMTAENLAKVFEPRKTAKYAATRIVQVFNLAAMNVYVHGECGDTLGERYRQIMKKAGLTMKAGDALVSVPWGRSQSDNFAMVYRKEGKEWKIISW